MSEEQISLFGEEQQTNLSETVSNKLAVTKLEFVEGMYLSWQELFSGYNELHAITYSSGVGFIGRLVEMFDSAEIIFGCEQVMSYNLQEIMAFQTKVIEKIRSGKTKDKLIERINSGTLKMYVANKKLSHEKIYLLSSDDGRKRVIMGSANMSYNAFGGLQRENISFIDGEEAYDWYMDIYQSLRQNSTDEITAKTLLVADGEENLDELPISQTVKIKKVLEIVSDKQQSEEIEFALETSKLSARLKPSCPQPDKKGKILISPTKIASVKSHVKGEADREKEVRKEYPQLVVDVEKCEVTLNDKKLDLSPNDDDVRRDAELFLQYMDGYRIFHGDYQSMQKRYFEFANWFFCSPFMGIMRDTATRFNQNKGPYPVFGIVYGQSKAGKTSFLETLEKMMIGQKPKISASDFTRTTIDGLRAQTKGVPIIVDDMVNTRFNQHAVETIKNDDYGIMDKNIHYPAVVISANEDVKAVSQEIIRRTVICHVSAGLTNTEVMQNSTVKKVQKNIGTAFYRRYLKKMLAKIPELLEGMKDDDAESAPDILKLSSEVIYEIFESFSDIAIPEYIRKLDLTDYFSEKITGSNVIQTITTAWNNNRGQFEIDARRNLLKYNAGQTYDASRIVKELPETLVPTASRELVIMKLDVAKEFFGIEFKRGLLDRFK